MKRALETGAFIVVQCQYQCQYARNSDLFIQLMSQNFIELEFIRNKKEFYIKILLRYA